MNYRLIVLSVIIVILGILQSLSAELPRIGIHPVNLFDIVPGYAIIALGVAIIAVTVAYDFFINRKG